MSSPKQTTSVKHRNFVVEPMGAKMVTALPGVGNVLGQRLTNKGYSKASTVLGEYLSRKEGGDFEGWMKQQCGATSKQTRECRNALDEWTRNNL